MNNPNLSVSAFSGPDMVSDNPRDRRGRVIHGGKIIVNVTGAATSKEVMTAAGLDWKVVERALSDCNSETGDDCRPIDDMKSLRRADNLGHLGIVGSGYSVLQNDQVFDFMDGLVKEKLVSFQGAGAFGAGRTIFVQARMGEDVEIVSGDAIEPYLLLSNSHDGSSAVSVCYTNTRVVCRNTLAMALRGAKRKVSLRHSGTVPYERRLEEARNIINEGVEIRLKHVEVLKKLAATSAGGIADLRKFFIDVLQIKSENGVLGTKAQNRLDTAFKAFESSPGNDRENVRGTRWAALNAVTYMVDHLATTRLPKDAAPADREFLSEHNRLESSMFGPGALTKDRALTYLTSDLN